MTAAQVPEPTAEHWSAAIAACGHGPGWDTTPTEYRRIVAVARAIATAVAAERAKYIKLANKWEAYAGTDLMWEPDDAYAHRVCAADVREVAEQ